MLVDNDYPSLELLIGAAVFCRATCNRLLNGQRRQVAMELGLSDSEIEVVMTIEATTLPDFAQSLLDWMAQQPSVA